MGLNWTVALGATMLCAVAMSNTDARAAAISCADATVSVEGMDVAACLDVGGNDSESAINTALTSAGAGFEGGMFAPPPAWIFGGKDGPGENESGALGVSVTDDGNWESGSWSTTTLLETVGDQMAIVVKAGNGFAAFFKDISGLTNVNAGTWSTGGSPNLSHLSVYYRMVDEPNHDVPEPATLALMGTGLIGLGAAAARRRRVKAAA